MEDQVVKPGLYAYQFRVDIDTSSGLTRMMSFIKKYDVKHYIVGAETSDKGKQHFQCILWFQTKIDTSKLRNWWKGKADTTKQPVSLTTAKKIKNLAKYTMKENNFVTNLSKEEIQLIGKWSPKVKKAEWSQLLDDHAKKFNSLISDQNYQPYSELLTHFLCYMLDFFKANNKRPSRASLQYLAWKHGYMSNQFLIQKWF